MKELLAQSRKMIERTFSNPEIDRQVPLPVNSGSVLLLSRDLQQYYEHPERRLYSVLGGNRQRRKEAEMRASLEPNAGMALP